MTRKEIESGIEQYVDASAAVLGLTIAPEHRPGVLQYFELAASHYDLVSAHALTIADDPAPVFVPVVPTADLPAVSTDAENGVK